MTIEHRSPNFFFLRLGTSNTSVYCPIYITCMKALLAEFSIFLRRTVDFIKVSECISGNTNSKPKRGGNTWPGEVSYKKRNLCYSLSSVVGIGKKKSRMDQKPMRYEHSSHQNKVLVVMGRTHIGFRGCRTVGWFLSCL